MSSSEVHASVQRAARSSSAALTNREFFSKDDRRSLAMHAPVTSGWSGAGDRTSSHNR